MPIVAIQLAGGAVTQQQKDALVMRAIDMIKEILNENAEITGVPIEEAGASSWGAHNPSVTHRFRSPKGFERCLITRWQAKRT